VTEEDVEMLLDVRIKRISLFDMNQNRKEIDDILIALDEVEKNLGRAWCPTPSVPRGLLKKYGEAVPAPHQDHHLRGGGGARS
jgi:topoisomerase-4 subunit A